MSRPEPMRIASSRFAAFASRFRVFSIQAASASALAPTASAGPDTAQGPSAARQSRRHDRRGEREAEPQPGEPVELAERAQHDDVAAPNFGGEARAGRADIHERFVDHEHAAARAQFFGKRDQSVRGVEPAVGIVGVGDDNEVGIAGIADLAHGFHAMSGERRGAGKLGIGRFQDGGAAGPHQSGDKGQQNLRARRRHDMGRGRSAIGARGDRRERDRSAPGSGRRANRSAEKRGNG